MKKVGKASEVSLGTMKGFIVSNKPILIANVKGEFFAVDAVCSHMNGYLPRGELKDNILTCPVHHAQFDVTTGNVVKNVDVAIKFATHKSASNLKSYKLLEKKGILYIEL